ncbi:hypothetical protein [Roseovarius sp.]|uniref:hypothetical protein n=1 Tax=Roseovarius sp. TaxID=1486281 RepID=UPI003BAA6199
MLQKLVNIIVAHILLAPQFAGAALACTEFKPPSMCDDPAHQEAFWIGEYSGEQLFFEMTINGNRFDPPLETKGKLTLFDMEGRLGFAGDGAFRGEAKLGPLHSGDEALQNREGFEFLFDKNVKGSLRRQEGKYCTFEFWPRWAGTYKPPQSPTMNIELIGMTATTVLGHVFYDGVQNGNLIHISSKFILQRESVDVSGWKTVTHPDDSLSCRSRCLRPGVDLETSSVWGDCPTD